MANRKTKKPTRKHLERFRFNTSTVNCSRKGYLVKTVRKLVRHISRRLRILTSKRRRKHQAARRLMIVIKYQNTVPTTRAKFSCSKRLKTYQRKIPLRTEERQKYCQLNFWHELDLKSIQWRVLSTCCQIKREYFRRAKYIGIKALKFVPLHLPRWIADTDPKEIEYTVRKIKEQSGITPDTLPFIPMAEFEKVLQTDDDYYQSNKIPMIKSCPSMKRSDIKKTSGMVISKRARSDPQCVSRKMRQTTIDEYFKPRGMIHSAPVSK